MSQLELLAANFDEAFSAPDGIKRLRELILTLAMQGKLVEQDPSEGTADTLLAEIEIERPRLVAMGQIKISTPLTPVLPEEIPSDLPEGWAWVRLGTLIDVLNGRAYKQSELLDSGTPVLRVGNLFTSKKWYYSNLELEDNKYVDAGDLIYAWSASFGPFIWTGSRSIYHYHIWKLRLIKEEKSFKEFLYHFLNYKTESIKQSGNGIAMLHMTKERMELLPVPLPPLAEQRRIVARIDQLMARCDELEALRAQQEQKRVQVHTAVLRELTAANDPAEFQQNWQFLANHFGELHATPQNVTELRSAILQLAVMGKLVPQDPNEGTARKLLTKIEQEQRQLVAAGQIKALKPLPTVSADKQPYPIPNGWEWTRFGNLALSSDSGWSPQCEAFARSGDAWGVLKVSAVSWGAFQPDENKSLPQGIEPRREIEVKKGDFLITRANTEELVARSVIIEDTPPHLMMSDKIIRFRLSNYLDKNFINMCNSAKSSRNYYAAESSGTSSSMKNVSREVIANLTIPLPPLGEQHRIVDKVNQLSKLCDVLESYLNERSVKQGELLRAIMAELSLGLSSSQSAPNTRSRVQVLAGSEPSRGRGRPRKATQEPTEATSERRGRGRPRKDASNPARSIPEASSMEDAIRRLEAQKLERAQGSRQVSLFATED